MIDRLSAWSDDDSGVHIDTLQDHSDPYTERAWIAYCFLSSRLLYTTRLSAKSTWFYLLHWGHCWCHRAAQCSTTHIRWRHTAACQCHAGRQFDIPTTAKWLRRQCDRVVHLATVAAKCWQDRDDLDRIENSHQQAIVAGPVAYCRYGYYYVTRSPYRLRPNIRQSYRTVAALKDVTCGRFLSLVNFRRIF